MCCGVPYILKMFQRPYRCMLSNAFSSRHILPLPFCALFYDVTKCKYLINAPHLLRNPACSFLSFSSTASVRRCIMIFAMILLGIDRSVIPRQLLQSPKLPFFGIFMIIPSDQSSGISFFSQIVLNSGWSSLEARSGSALKSSAFWLSWPVAIPFLGT